MEIQGIVFFIGHHWQEISGVILGTLQPVLAGKNNPNNYLLGIAAILLSLWVYLDSKLYADFLLNLYYLAMSIYGWLYWKFGKAKKSTPITYSTVSDFLIVTGIILGSFCLMAFWLHYYTDSNVPYWDASVSAFAWGGMWLMAKRKIENWIALDISNLIAVPLLFYKGLYIYAAHTVLLFVLGIVGFISWNKIIKYKQNTNGSGKD